MSQQPATKCLQCGAKRVRLRTRPGRTYRYRNMAALAIPDDFLIPTCGNCNWEQLDEQTAQRLDEVLLRCYQHELQRRAHHALDVLINHVRLRRLEILLGLSQGYLSRLRHEAGVPSPELVSNLRMLARDPKLRLLELERDWATPSVLPRSPAPAPCRSATQAA